ncbi:MAG: L,D-transpeptidase family protein [Bauldia sp.]
MTARNPIAGRSLRRIVVVPAAGDRRRGLIIASGLHARCALGRSGTSRRKREGDGATPAGRFSILAVLYRADRLPRPLTRLPTASIRPDLGWCDDPAHRRYNRLVRLPFEASHERLWRQDHLYDLVAILDYNLPIPQPGAGSAIFLHVAAPDFAPTAGCIALAPNVMRRLLAVVGPRTAIEVR